MRIHRIALIVSAVQIASCASVDEDALQHTLDASVGQRFANSRWGGPTVLKRVLRDDSELRQVYEITWNNGCSHQIMVRKADDSITGWRFASDPGLCKNIMHGPLGS